VVVLDSQNNLSRNLNVMSRFSKFIKYKASQKDILVLSWVGLACTLAGAFIGFLLREPNSGLGQAFNYMRNHWEPLTLFMRLAGAPLDNNICERSLKMAILHRKNSLGYKTQNGARLGDMFMSLIHTCRLCAANPLNYLCTLQRRAKEALEHPTEWLPWNNASDTS